MRRVLSRHVTSRHAFINVEILTFHFRPRPTGLDDDHDDDDDDDDDFQFDSIIPP